MTRDCGHGTGDDQRLRTRHRDDQRLRTVQMTADLWGGGSGYLNLTEVRAGTCQIQVPAPHLPKGQQSSP
ncbi:unnamed protein product [Staurois parvus]|uniref:Uncharacterized protein n=1 Tax=Staurois parvus TaxID=386267 RepID=A0ABN9FZ47_9NEOB|nr:unnamed protein product [Staurois parvus]